MSRRSVSKLARSCRRFSEPGQVLHGSQIGQGLAEGPKGSMPRAGIIRQLVLERIAGLPVEADIRRQCGTAAGQPADDRAEGGPPAGSSRQPSIDFAEIMVVFHGANAAQQGQLIHHLGLRGISSQICTPFKRVAIGWKGPRYSAGASGLRSYMSMWLGPPPRTT